MARPKILVFQHVPYEPLGTLDPLLKEAGFRIRYVNFGRDPHQRPSLDKYEALIVLGGPMNAHQIDTYPNLATEVDVVREAVDSGMSVLGICLGAQLLAKALGGRVPRNRLVRCRTDRGRPHGSGDFELCRDANGVSVA
jgi:GMP synthase (glutamine-hydrolysing)